MQGGFLIRHSRLTALGIVLCVLAALFAVEAKIAWFSPAGSASAQISFDKARPAEPPKALPLRFNAPAAPFSDFAPTAVLLPAVFLLAAAFLLASAAFFQFGSALRRAQVSSSPDFCAALFFRPPPSL
jgi:hypothetical protein